MRCIAIVAFAYSTDGRDNHWAHVGDEIEFDEPVGLIAQGYVRPADPAPAMIERQAFAGAPETQVVKGPRGLWYVMRDGRRVSRGFATKAEARE